MPEVIKPSQQNKQEDKRRRIKARPHRKLKLQEVLDARATINDAYERAENITDPDDKLTILKTGYKMSTNIVPNYAKPVKQWHLYPIEPYQYKVIHALAIESNKIQPNIAREKALQKRLADIKRFIKWTEKHGIAYIDMYILLDGNFNSLTGISLRSFSEYIESYAEWLQQEYEQLSKKQNEKLMKFYKNNTSN